MIRFQAKKKLHSSEGPIQLEIAFEVGSGEFVTLFGKSGVGKTTILRMLAGLIEPEEGYIEVDGEVWFDSSKKINWPVQKRRIGFVFQENTLFPQMSVVENLRFALFDQKDLGLIDELLKIADLTELKNRRPYYLSGGQKQRVCLIRAYLRQPKIFLLDEPFSSLDMELRLKLQDQLLEMYQRFKVATIFVSHDFSDIFKLSHRVLLLEEGRIKKSAPAHEVFAPQMISGKFKFAGVILRIEREDFLYILTIQIGNNLTKVAATEEEIQGLKIGDKVIVAAKAFNPMILKASIE